MEGDVPLLSQLVSNVVTNAVRHNVPHGELFIASRHDRADGRSQLIVSNTGPVLDDATTADLFKPFRRGTPRSGGPRGSGLGLSVVKAVAEAHRGSVDARCRKGGGLEIRVSLPDRRISA
ncbi:ATP-binding protein [Streptomyces sp. TP-A0356]|uniref:ATP-binding protein n=1 Tax=Streptomyces sp. TP-A0356 TaxID=1359208 RepID=UPI0006E2F4DE|nr:ATP-binding protein [Streptomyces sp. TP-A0356]